MRGLSFAIVSKVLEPFGLKGEAKCSIETDIIENVTKQKFFYARRGERRILLEVEYCIYKGDHFIIKFKGIDTREAVKFFKGWFLEVEVENLVPLPEGEFYRFELIGFEVYTLDGAFVGIVDDFIDVGPHDIFVIKEGNYERLIPSVFVETIDKSKGRIVIRTIEGLV
ncbi:MAG: ribosome maturation factor RimM [Thermosulfidibacteraceae bacterium]